MKIIYDATQYFTFYTDKKKKGKYATYPSPETEIRCLRSFANLIEVAISECP